MISFSVLRAKENRYTVWCAGFLACINNPAVFITVLFFGKSCGIINNDSFR